MTDATPAPPTVANYLTFSELAYQLSGTASSDAPVLQPPPGWVTVLNPSDNPLFYTATASHMTAVAFVNTTTSQMVIAYRGSVGTPPFAYDWRVSDDELAQGQRPAAFDAAEAYATSLKNNNRLLLSNGQTVDATKLTLYTTGHSLGGAEAEDVAATFKVGGAAFAGPGVAALLTTGVSPIDAGFTDYINELDPVGNLNSPATGGYVGNAPVVLADPLTAIDKLALYPSAALVLTLDLAEADLFHPIASYAKALYQAGLIGSDPWANSTGSSDPAQIYVDLAVAFPGIQNVSDTKDAAGNFVETGTLNSGTETVTITETDFLAGGLSFNIVSTSNVGTTIEEVLLDKNGNRVSDNISVYGVPVIVPAGDNRVDAGIDSDGRSVVYVSNNKTSQIAVIDGNSNGSVTVASLDSSDSNTTDIITYAPTSNGERINVSVSDAGITTVNTELQSSAFLGVADDTNTAGVIQNFSFLGPSGVLQINNPATFSGTIYGFAPGGTIDISRPGLTATILSGNILDILQGTGGLGGATKGEYKLQLDPAHSYDHQQILISSDGSGGSYLRLQSYNVSVATFNYTNLSNSDPYSDSIYDAYSIQNDGTVVGLGYVNGIGATYIEENNSVITPIDLPIPNPPGVQFELYGGISNNGNIVADRGFFDTRAYIGTAQGVSNIIINPTDDFIPVAINNNQDVLFNFGFGDYASLYQNGQYQSFVFPSDGAPFGGGGKTIPTALNDQGDFAGTYELANGSNDAIETESAGFTDINGALSTIQVPGSDFTAVTGINNDDVVVGDYYLPTGVSHGFLYKNGSFFTFDISGAASTSLTGINDSGQVIGSYETVAGTNIAFEGNITNYALIAATAYPASPPVVTITLLAKSMQATSAAGAVETFAASATNTLGEIDPVVFTERLANGATKVVTSGETFAIGTHTIVASTIDAGGVTATSSFSFSIDDPIPDVTISDDYGGLFYPGYISGTVTPADGSPIQLFEGTTKIATVTPNGGYWSALVNISPNQIHVISAEATNYSGQTGVSNKAVFYSGNISVATFEASLPILTEMNAIIPITDTAYNIENGLVGLGDSSNNIAQIFSTDASVEVSVSVFLANQSILSKIAGGVIVSDTADNIANVFDTLNNDVQNIQAIAFTDSSSPSLVLTSSQEDADTYLLSKIISPYHLIVTGVPLSVVTESLSADSGSSANDNTTSNGSLSGTGTPNAVISFIVDGEAVPETASSDAAGAWTFTPVLPDGIHTIVANEIDAFGNLSGSASLTFTLDTTAPAVTEVLSGGEGTLSAALSGTGDAHAVVHFTIDGTAVSSATLADATGAWTFTATGLSDGSHTIIASETDTAGNTGTASLTFTAGTTIAPPTLNLTSVASGVTPLVSGIAETGATVTLFDGTTIIGHATADVSTGAYSIIGASLDAGEHVLTATATDASQQVSAASAPLTVEVGTAATIVSELDALEAKPGLSAIVLTDTHVLPVGSSAAVRAMITNDARALATIQGGYSFAVVTSQTGATPVVTENYSSSGELVSTTTASYSNGILTSSVMRLPNGKLSSETYSNGKTVSWTYNSDGTLKDVAYAGLTSAAYTSYDVVYGANGKQASVLYSNGQTQTWSYNPDGTLSQVAYAGVTGRSYTSYNIVYGANGKAASETYSNGQTVIWTYNPDKTLHDIAYGGITAAAYTSYDVVYGANGKQSSALYSNGQTETWSYNSDGTLREIAYAGVTGQPYTAYDILYGTNGKPASEAYSNGKTVTWTYGSSGALNEVAYGGITGAAYTAYDIVYGTNGKQALETYSNGQTVAWTYNLDNTLHDVAYAGLTGHPYTSYDLVYGSNGKQASASYSNGQAQTWTYALDGSYELQTTGITGQKYDATSAFYGSNGKIISKLSTQNSALVTVENWNPDGTVFGTTNIASTNTAAGPFGGRSSLDLFAFNPATATLGFQEDASNKFGILTLSDTAQQTSLSLTGQYSGTGFSITSDGHNGSLITYVPPQPVLAAAIAPVSASAAATAQQSNTSASATSSNGSASSNLTAQGAIASPSPAASDIAGLHSLVQAMATMTPTLSSTFTLTAPPPSMAEPVLAAPH